MVSCLLHWTIQADSVSLPCAPAENSYAANGVKHCVRPADMTGKSAVVLLRRIHPQLLCEAVNIGMDELAEHYGTMHLRDEDWPALPSKSAQELCPQSKRGATKGKIQRVYADDHERAASEALKRIVDSICAAERHNGMFHACVC
jgi:hypothetical protein